MGRLGRSLNPSTVAADEDCDGWLSTRLTPFGWALNSYRCNVQLQLRVSIRAFSQCSNVWGLTTPCSFFWIDIDERGGCRTPILFRPRPRRSRDNRRRKLQIKTLLFIDIEERQSTGHDREDHTKEEWFRFEVRAAGDIAPNRQARNWCAINYKLRGIQSEICTADSDQTLEFICRVWWPRRKRLPEKKSTLRDEDRKPLKLRVSKTSISLNCSQFALLDRIEFRSSSAESGQFSFSFL
jgi:hypothetical protein